MFKWVIFLAVFAILLGATIYIALRYRKKYADPDAPQGWVRAQVAANWFDIPATQLFAVAYDEDNDVEVKLDGQGLTLVNMSQLHRYFGEDIPL